LPDNEELETVSLPGIASNPSLEIARGVSGLPPLLGLGRSVRFDELTLLEEYGELSATPETEALSRV